MRVVEEDRPDRGVANAKVDVWRIWRVPVGGGAPPSDWLSDGRAKTDTDGWTTIQRITRRAAYLQVRALGFTMCCRTIPATDEEETELVVALARGTVVAGKVRWGDGSAARGVRVRGTQPEQWGWVDDSHEAVTDSRGSFRLSGIFPGLVSLYATLHDRDGVWVGTSTADAGSLDAEIRLPAGPMRRRIHVLVTGADGQPVASARWDAEDGLYMPWWRSSSHGEVEEGEFVLPADPDVRWFTISCPRDEDGQALPWATAVVGPLGTRGGDLQVVMPRGHTVSGTVRDEHGKALHDITVFVLIIVGETERPVSEGRLISETDWEGRFRIEGVPAGRVEVEPFKNGWSAGCARVRVPTGPLDFIARPQRRLRGCVRHPDGAPAPEAVLYAQGGDAEVERWTRVGVDREGNFSVPFYDPCVIRMRVGLSPSGVEDMAASEVKTEPGVDPAPIVLTVPRSRSLLVRIPDWPASAPGAARLANGPYSRGDSQWILGGTASFEGIDPGAPLSLYCGPLPDGRIAFSRDLSAAGAEVTVSLVPSRSIRGRARGFPSDAHPDSVWADTSAFEAPGHVGPDGRFLIRGVPPGACRVCVVFKRGEEFWAGSVWADGSGKPLTVEVRRLEEPRLAAWVFPRPPPQK